MMMFRLRRYRVFVICAAVVVFLLYRVSQNSQWETGASSLYHGYAPPAAKSRPEAGAGAGKGGVGGSGATRPGKARPNKAAPYDGTDVNPAAIAKEQSIKIPDLKTSLEVKGPYGLPTATPGKTSYPSPTKAQQGHGPSELDDDDVAPAPVETPKPAVPDIPDRKPGSVDDIYANRVGDDAPLHIMDPPAAKQEPTLYATSTIHWEKQVEHFPVPEESLIMLPTGKPQPIPAIQHHFEPETEGARKSREHRLSHIKGEMKRAWDGYRKFAWTHDELVPVAKSSRDPFCGWAATLVDALDTLWIMNMTEEFDDAYAALKTIDFTTTPYRNEIPVFETIIRYLGGLIAAFDVTGGHEGDYPLLLQKAVDLAEILMGVFDTPNRMPILYYNWKPTYASQPHRASSSVSVAELGSMSMEFTRLAQLTGKNKYYDAIARITDAFEEWQDRGTALPGLFPQQVDASGCNRTAQALHNIASTSETAQLQAAMEPLPAPKGYQPDGSKKVDDTKPDPKAKPKPKPDIEFQVTPGDRPGEPGKGSVHKIGRREIGKRELDPATMAPATGSAPDPGEPDTKSDNSTAPSKSGIPPWVDIAVDGGTVDIEEPADPANTSTVATPSLPYKANGETTEFECAPQNLTSGGYGMDSYSMGGSQDSTYEYFPKQYILLGGLVPKYRTIHEKVVEATKKYLLYRPMVKDDRDILFSAKVYSRDGSDKDLTRDFEITHLTCFLGGMFALGGKIFDRPEDVEIGGKLAAGCAWAYEIMPTGIMPEGAMIMPCESVVDCKWNQTRWYQKLDPSSEWRDEQMKDYELRVQEWQRKKKQAINQQELRRLAEEEAQQEQEASKKAEEEERLRRPMNASTPGVADDEKAPPSAPGAELDPLVPDAGSPPRASQKSAVSSEGAKPTSRATASSQEKPPALNKRASGEVDELPANPKEETAAEKIEKKVQALEEELDLNSVGASDQVGGVRGFVPVPASRLQTPLADVVVPPEPIRPLTHTEYVLSRIEREHLPPGFVSLNDRRYLLRPEAIESVWYMYRITGDPIWRERGWNMYRSVIHATRAGVGHSAIDDVAFSKAPRPLDNMESFWLAETLKYFYLLFTEPDVISLDDWVLNTEAHPFRRPT